MDLLHLQNLAKRDPSSYEEEVQQQYRHFESQMSVMQLQPHAPHEDFVKLLDFVCHMAPHFRAKLECARALPGQLMELLVERADTLHPVTRRALAADIIMLRNRGLISLEVLLPAALPLFKVQDKQLRQQLFSHLVNDVARVNKKHPDQRLNRRLQSHFFAIMEEDHPQQAHLCLRIMLELYKRGVWCDERPVNVISNACFSQHNKVMVAAIHFFLGSHMSSSGEDKEEVDSDEEGAGGSSEHVDSKGLRELYHNMHKGAKKTQKRQTQLKRAIKMLKKKKSKPSVEVNVSAIQLLYDPHTFAEKLFAQLKKAVHKFDIRTLLLDLISRLIGFHELIMPAFYSYLQKYISPHQENVTKLMACAVQACHSLVPPDCVEPLIHSLANQFVTDRNSSEAIALGLNTIREIAHRQPLCMDKTLLQDLVDYKKYKDKGVAIAARSLIQLFRIVNPQLLKKKDRGKLAATSEGTILSYGQRIIPDSIDGADLLQMAEEMGELSSSEGEGDEWEKKNNSQVASSSSMEGDDGDWVTVDASDEEVQAALALEKEEKKQKRKGKKKQQVKGKGKGKGKGKAEEEQAEEKKAHEAEEDFIPVGSGDGHLELARTVTRWKKGDKEEEKEKKKKEEQAAVDSSSSEDEEGDEEEREEEEEEEEKGSRATAVLLEGDSGAEDAAGVAGAAEAMEEDAESNATGVSSASSRIDIARFLTPKDFARLKRLRMKKDLLRVSGKRMRDDEALTILRHSTDPVDPESLTTAHKRRRTKEERLQSVLEGREDRMVFGSKKSRRVRSSTTNKEKAKNKPFMMLKNSSKVRGKIRMGGADRKKRQEESEKKQLRFKLKVK